jgi:hypothetical protein
MFKYKAMSAGTLSNPFRYVEKGMIVSSTEELNANWLKEFAEGEAAPKLPPEPPLMSNMIKAEERITLSKEDEQKLVDKYKDSDYDKQIQQLKKLEAAQDKKPDAPVDTVAGAESENTITGGDDTTGGASSGDQDVV